MTVGCRLANITELEQTVNNEIENSKDKSALHSIEG